MKVLVVDDHEIVRRGIASLIADTDIELVAEAADGEEATKLARKHKPDVVLLDVRMGEEDGLSALEQIRCDKPELPVIMISTYVGFDMLNNLF